MSFGKLIFGDIDEGIEFYIKGRKNIRYLIVNRFDWKYKEVTEEEFYRLMKKAETKKNRRIKKEQAERTKRLKAISEKRETERQARKENKVKTESIHKTISEKTKGKYQMAKSEYAWDYLPTV